MSYIRLFFKENLSLNFNSNLDKSQSHYISKVMRMKESEVFYLFNNNVEWQARILEIRNGIKNIENAKQIWLAFAPIKSNYLNFMIQKATELGVTKFIPILTDRTVVRKINIERINKIIIEASEQSNRIQIPKLEKLIKLDEFLKIYKYTDILFGDLNSTDNNFKMSGQDPVCVLIGPEGDFTEKERISVLNMPKTKSVIINKNILRSETAAISIISIICNKILS